MRALFFGTLLIVACGCQDRTQRSKHEIDTRELAKKNEQLYRMLKVTTFGVEQQLAIVHFHNSYCQMNIGLQDLEKIFPRSYLRYATFAECDGWRGSR